MQDRFWKNAKECGVAKFDSSIALSFADPDLRLRSNNARRGFVHGQDPATSRGIQPAYDVIIFRSVVEHVGQMFVKIMHGRASTSISPE